MRLIITCEHRFALGSDGSVWTRVACDYSFWERYLSAFDSVRVVARAKLDQQIDSKYRAVTGPCVEFWPLPYYLGPEQFLLRRRAIRKSLFSAVGESDALLCRVGSPLADELLPSIWEAQRPYGLEVVGDPYEAMGPGTIRHPLRPLFRARSARSLRTQCSRAVAVAYVTRESLERRYPSPAHSVGISDVGQLDFTHSPKVFTTNYSSVYCDDADFVGHARQFQSREQPRILFVGSLAQMYKGPDVLLKAVKLLLTEINPTVVMVGDGKHRVELEQLAGRLGIADHVRFLGELPSGQAIRDQFDQATLFVMPSRTEGLPRAMIEAMTRALPCIGTRVGGIPELLDDRDLVDSEDVAGLADKIKQVVTNPARLSEMSRRNLHCAQEYRPEVLDKRRAEFYGFLRQATQRWRSVRARPPLESPRSGIILGVTSDMSISFVRDQASFLSRKDFDVSVVSSPGKQLEALSHQGIASVGIPMRREISPVGDFVSLYRLWRLVRRSRPAIVEFGTPKAGLLGILAAWATRVPCRIYTMHGLKLETTKGILRSVLLRAERLASSCADRVLCVSESLRQRVVELGIASLEKTVVLAKGTHNGVDLDRFSPALRNFQATQKMRSDLEISEDALVIGFVGRLVKDKGIRELAEAFRILSTGHSKLRLLVVGAFETGDPVETDVRSYIESAPAVVFQGFVDDTAPYYGLMDVLVLPTYREGFPGAPLEAQASGVPVVTTTATGAIDSVIDGVTGILVPVGDSNSLALAIDKLLRDAELRASMGRAGRERMERDFRPETIWQAQVQLYRDLLQEKLGKAPNQSRVNPSRAGGWPKRVFDLLVTIGALPLLSPVLAAIAGAIRLFIGSPVMFRQRRTGLHGQLFTCLKFRTMTDARDPNGQLLPDADRLTPLGRFLRNTSLDELPELFNVIRGEMSLVGPRPLLPQYLERYTREQMRRHEVKPGITGWAQVNGRNSVNWEQKFAYDIWYVENRNFWLDVKILALTLWKTLKREGISQPGHATMQEFRGAARPE